MKRLLVPALLLACSFAPLTGATLERLSLDDMILKSTSIVRGKVSGSFAAFSGPLILTHYTVQISERFKGAPLRSEDVVVPGGTVNGLQQTVAGAPEFHAGEEYVFFLFAAKSGLTYVIGMTQGVFALTPGEDDPTGTRRASRELMLDAATGRPTKDETLQMRLSELRARIAGTLAPKGTGK